MYVLYSIYIYIVMSFSLPHSDTFTLFSSESLSRWLRLSFQLISNGLYWHD